MAVPPMEQNMFTEHTTRMARLSLAMVAAAALPLGLAAAAHASTTRDGCTVNPLPAEYRGTSNPQNIPYVFYPYEVTCDPSAGGLSVEVKTVTWEQDLLGAPGDVDADGVNNADEDRIGTATTHPSFGAAGGTRTVTVRGVLPHTDTNFDEEVYQAVKFRVTSGPVTGGWSAQELTVPSEIGW